MGAIVGLLLRIAVAVCAAANVGLATHNWNWGAAAFCGAMLLAIQETR
jgi:hypothetical protein